GQMKFVQRGYDTVLAVPNDMIISGYDSKAVSTLRLWSAKSPQNMDMNLFSQGQYVKAMEHQAMCEAISKVLYPEDAHPEGKSLRLKQQYFFVSATIQFIVAQHKERYGSLDGFAKHVAIHINDTHPTVAIPELMRILIDEEGYAWDDAWDVVTNSLAYTNHTVMAEALERWTASLFKRLLPRIYQIVEEINRRFCDALWRAFPGEWKHIGSLAIMSDDEVRMANLCVAACFSVNGVSALHSDILKNTVFKEFYGLYPGKFKNVTNGIAHRRWLKQANPELSSLICELIGDKFLKEPARLSELTKFANDNTVLDKLGKIKGHNKERLVKTMEMRNIENSIFDVQAKRMHEYKRQLLNVLHIMRDYHRILDGNTNIVPRTYVFAAKAAPGYYIAKQIIRFICSLESEIENCPAAAKLIQVKFLEDYSVTLAERLIPAAEVSEQISIAGKEASGTGNMKFMLNGALTVGTMDGANVEICEAVGQDNIYIFGLRSDEVARLEESKSYCPSKYYQDNMELRRIIDHMRDGIGVGALKASYGELVNSLLLSDTYMVFKDFDDYCRVQDIISEDYGNKREWNRKSLYNIANAGRFSADRSIKEYANGIWRIKPLENLR
ncbi:MAG: glycogen/starch/alpha-glucan phosphorylase, partial [Clostridia bacterium]